MVTSVPSSPPTLLTVTSNGSTTITLHFDRAVSAGTGNIVVSDGFSQSYVGSGGLSTRIVGATDSRKLLVSDGQISYSGHDVVITLSTPLKSGLDYSITMDTGSVQDTDSSTGINGISSPKLFHFTASGAVAETPATPSAVVDAAIHFTDTGNSSDYITNSHSQNLTGSYTGTVGSNEFIQVSLDNGASWHQATLGSGNSWSYCGELDTANLTDNAVIGLNGTLLARVSNVAGGSSGTASQAYVFNDHAIAIEISSSVHFSADTGSSYKANSGTDLITNTAAQTISGSYGGTLIAGQTLQVSVDGGAHWVDATASNGAWQASATLSSGSNTLQMRAIDGAGNTSSLASSGYQLITSTVSLAGKSLTLASGSDTGVANNDGITNNPQKMTLDVAGLHGFHVGDTIEIIDTSHASAVVGSYVIQSGDMYYGDDYFSTGYYYATARNSVDINLNSTLADGSYGLVARIVDVAGNIAAASNSTLVQIDHSAPIISTSAPVENASSVSTGLTQLVLTFDDDILVANGSIVTVSDDNNADNNQEITLTSGAVSGRTLTIVLKGPLTSGTHYTVQGLTVSDTAGNAITGDSALLHFTTAGAYNGTPPPNTPLPYTMDSAPESANVDSPLQSDGITNNHTVQIEGLNSSGTWYYRLSSTDTWHQGSGSSFTLADGVYGMNDIQVKQTVAGVDSGIASINHAVTVDTIASTAVVAGTPASFLTNADSIHGTLTNSVDLPDEIVEVTFDHGGSWVKADTTFVSTGTATWSISGLLGQQIDNYGVRLADEAGNLSVNAGQGNTNPVYYLTNNDVTFDHPDDNGTSVFGGNGIDVITLGDHAMVSAGNGALVTTGSDAKVTVGNNATVNTGSGANSVTAGFSASVTTGDGADTISLSAISGATLHAGAGTDTLTATATTVITLASLASSSGVDIINFTSGGVNELTITGAGTVHNLTDSDSLTISAVGSGSKVHLDGSVWGHTGSSGAYEVYHSGQGSGSVVILIGANITVDTLVGSA